MYKNVILSLKGNFEVEYKKSDDTVVKRVFKTEGVEQRQTTNERLITVLDVQTLDFRSLDLDRLIDIKF